MIILPPSSISTTGILDDLKVYPNPVSDILIVEGVTMPTVYKIYQASGAEARKGTLATGTNTINVSGLPEGIYFIQLTSEGNGRKTVMIQVR